ncbi:MAG: hypothetical protein HC860_21070 [Alkalinema sp. RU_4_3]|nr:hypothetical protein [Alkalinema sp. RU_4_3]
MPEKVAHRLLNEIERQANIMSDSPQNSRSRKILVWMGFGGMLAILSAIAVHKYITAANKCCHPDMEARNFVPALLRSEQVYYLDNKQFTESFQDLGQRVMSPEMANDYSINVPQLH